MYLNSRSVQSSVRHVIAKVAKLKLKQIERDVNFKTEIIKSIIMKLGKV